MLRPVKCLLFTQLALSAALFTSEEEDVLDEPYLDESFLEDEYITEAKSSDLQQGLPTPERSHRYFMQVQTPVQEDELIADESQYPTISERSPLPAGTPAPERRHHYVVMGEMLYLKPSFDSMPWLYVYNDSQNNDPDSATTTFSRQSEHLKTVNIPYDFGFRLATGFNTTWLNLETLLSWERFHTHHRASVPKLPFVNFADPTFNQPVTYFSYWNSTNTQPTGQIYFANNKTHFKWDQIDLTGKIPLKALNRFTLSPLLGVRAIITSFETKTTFFTTQFGTTNTTTPPFNENITSIKQNFRAIGLLGGLDADINFGKGFHLSTLLDGALVFGELKSRNNAQMIVPVQPTVQVPTIFNTALKDNGFKPILDAQVTLSWNRAFWKDKITLNLHIGYEAHFVPNFFELIYYIADNTENAQPVYYDLTMQGLDAGIGLSF